MRLRLVADTLCANASALRAFKSCNGSQKLRKERQSAKDGEFKAGRMRHALRNKVIHLHKYYAFDEQSLDTMPKLLIF